MSALKLNSSSTLDIYSKELAKASTKRVFATAPGAYGAGINRLAERSVYRDWKQIGRAHV